MSEKFTSLLAACAATLVVFAATSPAAAQDRAIVVVAAEDEVPVRYVSYRDLNLAKAEDEKILVKRVRYAAKDVCIESVPEGFHFAGEYRHCRTKALDGAKPQIALAVTRAREIAANGWSAIAPVAITLSVR